MKRLVFLLICWLVVPPLAPAQENPLPTELHDLEAYVQQAMQQWGVPGLSMAITYRGKVVYLKGFGVRENGKPDPVDGNTVFAVGSNTKAFTALMVSQLAHEGKLALDDQVTKYWPDFSLNDPSATALLTIRDLLTHRIGLGTWHGDLVAWGSTYSREDLIRMYHHIKPVYSFRSGFGYQNVAFLAAGELAAKRVGTSWDDWVMNRIFKPLAMSRSTTHFADLAGMDNVAAPHTADYDGKLHVIPYRNIDNIAPAGSITSSAADMAHWIIMQADSLGRYDGREVFKPLVIKRTHYLNNPIPYTPYDNPTYPETHLGGYGLGWFMRDYHGKMLYEHGGGVDGMISQTGFMPELNLGWVILSNRDTGNSLPTALMYHIVDAYLGLPRKDWSAFFLRAEKQNEAQTQQQWNAELRKKDPSKIPTLPYADYAGTYEHPHYGQVEIGLDGDGLFIRPQAHPGVVGRLTHWVQDRFLVTFNDLEFGRAFMPFKVENGRVVSFEVSIRPEFLDPLTYTFTRK